MQPIMDYEEYASEVADRNRIPALRKHEVDKLAAKDYTPDQIARHLQPFDQLCRERAERIAAYEAAVRGDMNHFADCTIGYVLTHARLAQGWSVAELSERMKQTEAVQQLTVEQIEQFEACDYRDAGELVIDHVSRTLGLRISYSLDPR